MLLLLLVCHKRDLRRGIRKVPLWCNRWLLFALLGSLVMAQSGDVSELSSTKWKLIDVKGVPGLTAASKFSVSFTEDTVVASGCNTISVKFRLDQAKLILTGPLRSTRKACFAGEKLDEAFSGLVDAGASVRREGNSLILTGKGGQEWSFENEPVPSKNAKTRFIYVAAFEKDCSGVAPMKCLQVRDSKDQPWQLHYTGIVGFEHVPGIEYRLRIKEDRVARPAADASSIVWYLDAVVEQSVVDRKAADEYLHSKRR